MASTKRNIQPIPRENIGYVYFSANITKKSTDSLFTECLKMIGQGVKCIYIMLTSSGGDTRASFSAHNTLRTLPCRLVVHNMGNGHLDLLPGWTEI